MLMAKSNSRAIDNENPGFENINYWRLRKGDGGLYFERLPT